MARPIVAIHTVHLASHNTSPRSLHGVCLAIDAHARNDLWIRRRTGILNIPADVCLVDLASDLHPEQRYLFAAAFVVVVMPNHFQPILLDRLRRMAIFTDLTCGPYAIHRGRYRP